MNEAQAIRLMEWLERTYTRNGRTGSMEAQEYNNGTWYIEAWERGQWSVIDNAEDAVEFCDWAGLQLGRFNNGKQG